MQHNPQNSFISKGFIDTKTNTVCMKSVWWTSVTRKSGTVAVGVVCVARGGQPPRETVNFSQSFSPNGATAPNSNVADCAPNSFAEKLTKEVDFSELNQVSSLPP